MSVKSRVCLSCPASYFDDRSARCPTCDAESWRGLGQDKVDRVLAVRQAEQRKLADQWQREQAERRVRQ